MVSWGSSCTAAHCGGPAAQLPGQPKTGLLFMGLPLMDRNPLNQALQVRWMRGAELATARRIAHTGTLPPDPTIVIGHETSRTLKTEPHEEPP